MSHLQPNEKIFVKPRRSLSSMERRRLIKAAALKGFVLQSLIPTGGNAV